MWRCPACPIAPEGGDAAGLARHLVAEAGRSDPDHVRWLNQNISRTKRPVGEIADSVARYFDLGGRPLSAWIRRRFVEKFYGAVPHPFVVALQHPSRTTLLGYVVEHQHFLRQWVRSCALITARTDRGDVIVFEIENLATEFGGFDDRPSHYELLLRMGESLGFPRQRVLATPPLPATRRAIEGWQRICTEEPWVAAMAAMHGLELIANRELVQHGATIRYFDPAILRTDGPVTPETKAFLREGYEADVGHSEVALRLVDRYADELGLVGEVQSVFARSIDLFDDYLIARLERGDSIEG